MDTESLMELLNEYIELSEKQEEIINSLTKIMRRQARELRLLQNDRIYSGGETEQEKRA